MAVGDQTDCLGRLKAVLPGGWFPANNSNGASNTPVLDGVLSGCANGWAWCYSLLAFVKAQSRRLTASGIFIDMIAADFFGSSPGLGANAMTIKRRTNETDAALSTRIGKELFREKATRRGLIQALSDLTGRTPAVFEPAYANDTGAWGYGATLAWGLAGGYGNLSLPFQFFVTAYRPAGLGVAAVAGYANPVTFNVGAGGYGVGAIEWANPAMFAAPVTDTDILNRINDVRPVASIAWTRLSS